jgi:HSP20 family molecular chaperone IbpA
MSGIKQVEKQHIAQLESSRRRLEQRIKNLQNDHDHHVDELDKTHKDHLVDLKQTNQIQISEENEKKDKIIREIKASLNQSKQLADKELYELQDFSEIQKDHLQKKMLMENNKIREDQQLSLDNLNQRFSNAIDNVNQTGKMRLQNMSFKVNNEIRELHETNEKKIENDLQEFNARSKNNEINYLKIKNQQDQNFKKERHVTHLKQVSDTKKMSDVYKANLDHLENQYRQGIKEQEIFFEEKFNKKFEQQNASYKRIEDKNKSLLEELKNSLTKEISKVAERNDDPFYQFESIKPRMKELSDGVEIKVDVPEYSKQDLHLSLNPKEVIVSFDRRYHDATKKEDGVINKVNKVESYTTRMPTERLLDSKTLKTSYENGTMTYTVKYS